MGNPIKQVRLQTEKLAKYLEEHDVDILVEGIVFFSNPNSIIQVRSTRTPVFTSSHQVKHFILDAVPQRNISETEIEKAKQLISARSMTK